MQCRWSFLIVKHDQVLVPAPVSYFSFGDAENGILPFNIQIWKSSIPSTVSDALFTLFCFGL